MHPLIGVQVQDKITGFKGMCTGYVQYISGCNQCLVQPPVGPDGKRLDGEWFDEQRLDVMGKTRLTLDNAKAPGFDSAPPVR
jgi:hypothetical protein